MPLPIVDCFSHPYEVWSTRDATLEEAMEHLRQTGVVGLTVRDRLEETIGDARQAAEYIARVGDDNRLSHFINSALDRNPNYRTWRASMPRKTPPALATYRRMYPTYDSDRVNADIHQFGTILTAGQKLFHGGRWFGDSSGTVVTERPLSVTLCPQVALVNALWNGKAYDAGRIDLLVLRVMDPATKVFVFRRAGAALGHENEVLFAAGARLTLRSELLVRPDFPVGKWEHPPKNVPIYVLNVDIS